MQARRPHRAGGSRAAWVRLTRWGQLPLAPGRRHRALLVPCRTHVRKHSNLRAIKGELRLMPRGAIDDSQGIPRVSLHSGHSCSFRILTGCPLERNLQGTIQPSMCNSTTCMETSIDHGNFSSRPQPSHVICNLITLHLQVGRACGFGPPEEPPLSQSGVVHQACAIGTDLPIRDFVAGAVLVAGAGFEPALEDYGPSALDH